MTQDMAIKWLSGVYPLHEVILIRSTVAAIIILAVFLPLEGGLSAIRTNKLTVHILRGFGIVVANLAFYMGLASMSLAEAVGDQFPKRSQSTRLCHVIFVLGAIGIW